MKLELIEIDLIHSWKDENHWLTVDVVIRINGEITKVRARAGDVSRAVEAVIKKVYKVAINCNGEMIEVEKKIRDQTGCYSSDCLSFWERSPEFDPA